MEIEIKRTMEIEDKEFKKEDKNRLDLAARGCMYLVGVVVILIGILGGLGYIFSRMLAW